MLSRLWQQQEIRVADGKWVVLTTARRRRVRSIGADGLIAGVFMCGGASFFCFRNRANHLPRA